MRDNVCVDDLIGTLNSLWKQCFQAFMGSFIEDLKVVNLILR